MNVIDKTTIYSEIDINYGHRYLDYIQPKNFQIIISKFSVKFDIQNYGQLYFMLIKIV